MQAVVAVENVFNEQMLSALPPKADKRQMSRYVCFVPKADEVRRTNCVRGLATNMPASTIGFAGFQV